jgi:hypothetical protein
MRYSARPVSQHRLSRYHGWAMLWLRWFAAFVNAVTAFAPLSAHARRIAHVWLDSIERLVLNIAIRRSEPHVRLLAPRMHAGLHPRKNAGLVRAIMGARLRRLLRSADVRARIEKLMVRIDGLVRDLLRRAPRGLTRRRPIRTRRELARLAPCFAPCMYAFGADTS